MKVTVWRLLEGRGTGARGFKRTLDPRGLERRALDLLRGKGGVHEVGTVIFTVSA
jgi:hypothetical protein